MQLPKIGLLLFAVAVGAPAIAQSLGASSATRGEVQQYTAKEILTGSRDALDEMADATASGEKALDEAERKGDPEKEDCVRTRLNAMRALEGVSGLAYSEIQVALAEDQLGRANHEYRKIQVALTKVRQFNGEAQACVGDGSAASSSSSSSGGDAGTGDSDETDGSGIGDGVVGTDPPGTTPFE